MPVAEYSHDDGCSITGGYVYRGPKIAGLSGRYVYADYCCGKMWTLATSGGAARDVSSVVGDAGVKAITSFGRGRIRHAVRVLGRRNSSTASPRASRGARLRRRAGARERRGDLPAGRGRARRRRERAPGVELAQRQAHGPQRPDVRAPALRTFGPRTPEGVTRVFLVRRRVVGANCAAAWYQVDLPIRPNGVRGWVPAAGLQPVRRALAHAHRARRGGG